MPVLLGLVGRMDPIGIKAASDPATSAPIPVMTGDSLPS